MTNYITHYDSENQRFHFKSNRHFWTPKVRLRSKPKVFIIGTHKTGTTSLEAFLRDLGYRAGPERQFLMLVQDYHEERWEGIFKVIRNYEAFQDEPFNQATDEFIMKIRNRYPNAKFILSTGDDATEWFQSLLRFSRKKWAGETASIGWNDIQKVHYGRKGDYFRRYLRYHQIEGLDSDYDKLPFDQDVLENWYNTYNSRMNALFKDDSNFIQVNLKNDDTAERLKQFLGVDHSEATIKRHNATKLT